MIATVGDFISTPNNTPVYSTPANSVPTVTANGIPVLVVNGVVLPHLHCISCNTPIPTPTGPMTPVPTVTAFGLPVHAVGGLWSCGEPTLPAIPKTVMVFGL